MVAELPPVPREVRGVLDDVPEYVERFLDHVRDRAGQPKSLTVAECTALLAGLDAFGTSIAVALTAAHTDRDEMERIARARGITREAAYVGFTKAIVHCEFYADALCACRRRLVGLALQMLESDQRSPKDFVDSVVWPLLCRAWPTRACYEFVGAAPADEVTTKYEIWQDPGVSKQHLADCLGGRTSGRIDRLVRALSSWELKGQPRTTADYLRAAATVETNTNGRLVSAPVLFAPADRRWRLGHVLRVLVVPFASNEAGLLAEESLVPANQAAQALLGFEPLVASGKVNWQVAIGDYPGGQRGPGEGGGRGAATISAKGPSAGLMLGAALVAHVTGLDLQPDMYAAAKLAPSGSVHGLSGDTAAATRPGLRAKGRTVALLPRVPGCPSPWVLVGDETDGREMAKAASEFGVTMRVVCVESLQEAVRHLVPGIYGDFAARVGRKVNRCESGLGADTGNRIEPLAERMAQRILDTPEVHRWVFLIPGEAHQRDDVEGRLAAMALAEVMRKLELAARGSPMVPVCLSAVQLYQQLIMRPKRRLSEIVASLGRQVRPRNAVQQRARLAVIEAHLKTGTVVLGLKGLADLGERAASVLISELDSSTLRIITVAVSTGGPVPDTACGTLVDRFAFVEERVACTSKDGRPTSLQVPLSSRVFQGESQ